MALVAVEEVRKYAGIDDSSAEKVLEDLIDQVEAVFLAQVGRRDRPYQAGQTGRLDILDGTGTARLWLPYPIKTLTSLTLGYDSTSWDETLDPSDVTVLSWYQGSRRVVRVDGCRFGCADRANYVRVTYDTMDDLPEDVRIAIIRMVTALARESGLGEATANRTLPDGENLPAVADVVAQDMWQAAIAAHKEAAAS